MEEDFKSLKPDEIRAYFEKRKEGDYLLVDVRQPSEYEEGHIPGAKLIPLPELEATIFDLPSDRDLVFYCHSGARSTAAATFAVDAEVSDKSKYNLQGGIMAWEGKLLPDYPRVRAFEGAVSAPELLMTAMNLEKGAQGFYLYMLEKGAAANLAPLVAQLSKAEEGHARLVYGFWKEMVEDPEPFESLYQGLEGEFLEGGQSLEEVMSRLDTLHGDQCLNLVELALFIEYSAFDLYRHIAETGEFPEARQALLRIAQEEKQHIRILSGAVGRSEK